MSLVKAAVLGSLVLLTLAVPARAAVINFDDLADVADAPMPSPYQGFSWTDVQYFTNDLFGPPFGPDGFDNGIVSQKNAAYSGGADTATGLNQVVAVISSPSTFNFVSAYLGAVYYDTMNLTVQGFQGSTLLFSQVVVLDNNLTTGSANKFTFNFTNIDTIKMFGSLADPNCTNCSQFTMDDIEFTPVPEPSTLSLVALGAAAALRRRSRNRRAA